MPRPQPFYTLKELAREWGMSPYKIEKLSQDREGNAILQPFKPSKNTPPLYHKDALELYQTHVAQNNFNDNNELGRYLKDLVIFEREKSKKDTEEQNKNIELITKTIEELNEKIKTLNEKIEKLEESFNKLPTEKKEG